MPLIFLLKGLLVGFSIAAPVGPIGLLCIRRTLAEGRGSGLATGLGAATADALYGSVAAFGLTAVSGFLVGGRAWIQPLGGAFLLYLAARTAVSRPPQDAVPTGRRGLAASYTSALFLTLTNPMTIISFAAVFAALGLAGGAAGDARGAAPAAAGTSSASAALLVLGVFAGSAAWWLILSGGVSLFRARFSPRGLRWVNWLSAAMLGAFGLYALLRPLAAMALAGG